MVPCDQSSRCCCCYCSVTVSLGLRLHSWPSCSNSVTVLHTFLQDYATTPNQTKGSLWHLIGTSSLQLPCTSQLIMNNGLALLSPPRGLCSVEALWWAWTSLGLLKNTLFVLCGQVPLLLPSTIFLWCHVSPPNGPLPPGEQCAKY